MDKRLLSKLSNIVRDNNVALLIKELKNYPDEGRNILSKSQFDIIIPNDELARVLKQTKIPLSNVTLLHVAAYFDSLEAFIYIYNKAIPANKQSAEGFQPLHYSCIGGSLEVTTFLLSPGILTLSDLNNAPEGSYFTPIYLASRSEYNSYEILNLLFQSGAQILSSLDKKYSPIYPALDKKNVKALELLLSHSDTKKQDEKDYSPIMKAISLNFEDVITVLIEKGADINYQTPDKRNALYLALAGRKEKLVKYLVENGANVNLKGYIGTYPIHWAAQSDNVNIVNYLIANGATVNVCDDSLRPPTFSAILSTKNRDKILEILLDNGCDPNAVSRTKATILSTLVVMKPDQSVLNSIKIVLERGGDLNFVTKASKKTVYQLALQCHKETVNVINEFLSNHKEIVVK